MPAVISKIRVRDMVLAAVAAVVLGGLSVSTGPGINLLNGLPIVISMLGLLLVRFSAPLTSAIGIYLIALLQWLVFRQVLAIDVVVFVALYSVTAHGPRRSSVAGLVGGLIGAVMFADMQTHTYQGGPGDFFAYAALVSLMLVVVWALGLVRRARLDRRRAIVERAKALESERHHEAALAVAAERARIAREMHDIVAHSLAVIIAQADGGRYAGRNDPEAATKSLDTISEIGRDALADIRRILGVLRTTDGDAAVVLPQPTSDDLTTLIDRVRASGTHVSYGQIGVPRPLLPGMGLAIQRICQESLTNSLKHAGQGAVISVILQWFDDRIVLQVDDDGRGAAAICDGAGSGLLGMRERAALFGGTLQAGPRRGGGYRVHLVLPLKTPNRLPETVPGPPADVRAMSLAVSHPVHPPPAWRNK